MLSRLFPIAILALITNLPGCRATSTTPISHLPTAHVLAPSIAPSLPTDSTQAATVSPIASLVPTELRLRASAVPFLSPRPTTAEEYEQQLLVRVNALRASHGLPSYQHLPALSIIARAHSCDLAAYGTISHTSSDGRSLQERLADLMPPLVWPSESIAAGTADPDEVIAIWLDEPPDGWHRRNLLDPDQQVVGIGYCAAADDPTGNTHYWTMDIARYEP